MGLDLSIVSPAHDEEENVHGLVDDVRQALAGSGLRFELIVVDDGSADGTRAAIAADMANYTWLRGLGLAPAGRGRGHGQSAAFRAGILVATGRLIALIDADRQNDPADIPRMVQVLEERAADVVQGDRSVNRADDAVKRMTSWVGRAFRRTCLGDTIRDTGCSLRVLRRDVACQLPLQYEGMHRFIPYYARLLGYSVVEVPVRHRPRTAGSTKYGIWNRALPGLRDLVAVRWMRSRIRIPECQPVLASRGGAESTGR